MKLKITLKDPDGVHECLREAIEAEIPDTLSDEEQSALRQSRMRDEHEKLKKWLEFKEYVTVEFDTDAGIASVALAKPVR